MSGSSRLHHGSSPERVAAGHDEEGDQHGAPGAPQTAGDQSLVATTSRDHLWHQCSRQTGEEHVGADELNLIMEMEK